MLLLMTYPQNYAMNTRINEKIQSTIQCSLGENVYMDMYGWVPSLFTWNYHKIVNWLYPNTKRFRCLKKKHCALGPHYINNSMYKSQDN